VNTDRPTHWALWFHGIEPIHHLVELAREAERLGAGAILLADEGIDRDIYVVFAAIAAATERIALIPGITNPFSRHPVATAAALATLEELAPGRVVAGLGVGGSMVFGPMGVAPRRPFTALAETVDVVDRLLAAEEVTHHGEFVIEQAKLPWAPGRIPIAIAGRGPKVQRLAAERAGWVLLAGKKVAAVPDLVAGIRGDSVAAGRTPPAVLWNPGAAWTAHAIATTRPRFSYMTIDMDPVDRANFGITDETVAELRRLLLAAGPDAAAHLVPDAVLEQFAIVGDRERVIGALSDARTAAAPEVLAFEMHAYTLDHVADVADLATAAGCAFAHEPILSR
jgi:5,10-methylenetetrahydromethanopterin reductase